MAVAKIASVSHARPQKRSKLLGIGVGVMLSFLLLAAISTAYFSGIFVSANNEAPTELIIRRVTDTSAEIYWTTQDETQGLVQYGTNPAELTLIAPEVIGGTEHSQTLTLLQPETTYYFNIKIGEKVYDNGGVPWTFATKAEGFSQGVGQQSPVSAPQSDESDAPPVAPGTSGGSQSAPMASCPTTTNCEEIKNLLGAGCQTVDYIKCLNAK